MNCCWQVQLAGDALPTAPQAGLQEAARGGRGAPADIAPALGAGYEGKPSVGLRCVTARQPRAAHPPAAVPGAPRCPESCGSAPRFAAPEGLAAPQGLAAQPWHRRGDVAPGG